jgi:hypothetical protein
MLDKDQMELKATQVLMAFYEVGYTFATMGDINKKIILSSDYYLQLII